MTLMARPLALDEAAMEVQVAMRDVRLHKARPLWLAAINSCDWQTMADAKALEELLRAAERMAKHMAGVPRGACADGLLEPGHGIAA